MSCTISEVCVCVRERKTVSIGFSVYISNFIPSLAFFLSPRLSFPLCRLYSFNLIQITGNFRNKFMHFFAIQRRMVCQRVVFIRVCSMCVVQHSFVMYKRLLVNSTIILIIILLFNVLFSTLLSLYHYICILWNRRVHGKWTKKDIWFSFLFIHHDLFFISVAWIRVSFEICRYGVWTAWMMIIICLCTIIIIIIIV